MLNYSLYVVPFLIVAIFGYAVVTDYQTVFVDDVSVPTSLASSTGYHPDVVIARLADEMRAIERAANSETRGRELRLQDEHSVVNVIGDLLSVTSLIRVTQESTGLIPYAFEGDLVVNGRELEFRLRGFDAYDSKMFLVERAPLDQMPQLIHRMAFELMRRVDPYILSAYQFKVDFRQHDFKETLEIIDRALQESDEDYRKWLLNLWGIVLFQQADMVGAVERFEDALREDESFLSPHLNIGVALALQGKHLEAIKQFQHIIAEGARQSAMDSVVAAAYAEWGVSLTMMGRAAKALVLFENADRIGPTGAATYLIWGEALRKVGREREAAVMTARGAALAVNEKIYTEHLVGPVCTPPSAPRTR